MLNIAFVSSEFSPLAKTGGLADVAAGLTRFLAGIGQDVRAFVPYYDTMDTSGFDLNPVEFIRDAPLSLGRHHYTFSLLQAMAPSQAPIYLIDCPVLFGRGSLYTPDDDEHRRFAMLARAAIESCQRMGWAPDIFHCNDWHASLVPIYLRTLYEWDGLFRDTKTVLTIHNIGYQGGFPASVLDDLDLEDRADMLHQEDLAAGVVNFLKTGIIYADMLTTVSRTYAKEIQTPEYGVGLEEMLQARDDHLVGIVNGVDYGDWDPETDPLISHHYSADRLRTKSKNREALLEAMNLPSKPSGPVLGIVSRLTAQKGFDLMFEPLREVLAGRDVRLVALGSGEQRYEEFFTALQRTFPRKACFYRGYNNRLAHMIEAGSDAFLMPSRFEPCGLNQMYSMRYGTVPIVRRTGGLADTVEHFDPETGEGTGFVFDHYTADGFRWALLRALEAWANRASWKKVMTNGMAADFSWERQGREYLSLYADLCGK